METIFSYKRSLAALTVLVGVLLTFDAFSTQAHAFPWGGQFQQVIPCVNAVTFVLAGPPRGGQYLWTPGVTRTFQYGPPTHPGQYGIGLAGPPYFCIVSAQPILVFPGIIMTMLGTSQ